MQRMEAVKPRLAGYEEVAEAAGAQMEVTSAQREKVSGAKVGFRLVHRSMRSSHAGLFVVQDDTGDEFDDDLAELAIDELEAHPRFLALVAWFHDSEVKRGMRRGDILHYARCGDYRNAGRLIFDGEDLQFLSVAHDDEGHVPDTFLAISEFPPDYWAADDLVRHNDLVYADFRRLPPVEWREPSDSLLFGTLLHGGELYGVFFCGASESRPVLGLELCDHQGSTLDTRAQAATFERLRRRWNLVIVRGAAEEQSPRIRGRPTGSRGTRGARGSW